MDGSVTVTLFFPLLSIIVMLKKLFGAERLYFPKGFATPPIVAEQVSAIEVLSLPKWAVPKLGNGVMPEMYGASISHSAEETFALGSFVLTLKSACIDVGFLSVSVNVELLLA